MNIEIIMALNTPHNVTLTSENPNKCNSLYIQEKVYVIVIERSNDIILKMLILSLKN